MENYFTKTILYEDILQAFADSIIDDRGYYDSNNDADAELEPTNKEDFEYEINLFVTSIDELDAIDIANET